jgi:hypothetical protein
MESRESLDTHHKALSINLEGAVFGSFAEIGAGQEVARWFLQVGGASGTVAKTISAYDKEVSDDIYGGGSRYVSHERLQAMLDKEWEQLLFQLQSKRGAKTRFFSFVDTIVALNYAGTNLPHGWMGLRFQDQPGALPNDVILHINLKDPTNVQQQEAIGILGVNLLYAVFHERASAEELLKGLGELVAPHRLEIDYIGLRGPVFENDISGEWDARALHARLVAQRFAEAVIFTKNEGFLPFIEALHKRAVVLAPGIFEWPSLDHAQMMETALQALEREQSGLEDSRLGLFCVTIPPTLPEQPKPDLAALMQKMEALQGLGYGVLLVHEREIYQMSTTIQRFTALPIRFVVGISVLLRVFEDDYRHLDGSTLKALSLLFSQNVRIYAYPAPTRSVQEWIANLNATGWDWTDVEGVVFADSLKPPGPLRYLYEYLLASDFIVPVQPSQMTLAFKKAS